MGVNLLESEDSVKRVLRLLQAMLNKSNGEECKMATISSIDLFYAIVWIRYHLYGGSDAKRFIREEAEKACERLSDLEINADMEECHGQGV